MSRLSFTYRVVFTGTGDLGRMHSKYILVRRSLNNPSIIRPEVLDGGKLGNGSNSGSRMLVQIEGTTGEQRI